MHSPDILLSELLDEEQSELSEGDIPISSVVQGPLRLSEQLTSDLSNINGNVKNSDRFLLSLYENLVTGTGGTIQQLNRADTIRSFTPQGMKYNIIVLYYND